METLRKISFLLIFSLSFVFNGVAQDVIMQKNGEKLTVNIIKIDDEKIYYRYEEESVEYQISKSNVREILFKSGRKEVIKSNRNENTSFFDIEDVDREYIAKNIDLKVEERLLFSNLSSKEIHVTVYGFNIKSKVCEPLSERELIAPKEKNHRLAKGIDKGDLDHYSAFKFYVEEGHNGKIESRLNQAMEDLEIVLWDDEMEIERELEEPMSKLQIATSPYCVIVEIHLQGKNGETVCQSSNRKISTNFGVEETMKTAKPFNKVKMKVAGISGYDYKRGWFVFSNKEKKAKIEKESVKNVALSSPQSTTEVAPKLVAGSLTVSCGNAFRVYDDGKFIGMTNAVIPDLKAALHKIEIRGEGFAIVSDTVTIKSEKTNIHVKCEKLSTLATFVGGQDAFRQYLLDNLQYPETAYRREIGGIVEIGCVVDSKGGIKHVEIVKGVERTLDNEARKFVKFMPNWTPATLNGKNVKSFVIVPVVFSVGQ